jgi:hypothetical protein
MRFRFRSNWPYGGRVYSAGEFADLSALAVKNLTRCGAGEAVADEPAPTLTILEAIERLEVDDASLWLADGRPRVDAIERVLGRQITEAERDDAVRAALASLPAADVASGTATLEAAVAEAARAAPAPAEPSRSRKNRKSK